MLATASLQGTLKAVATASWQQLIFLENTNASPTKSHANNNQQFSFPKHAFAVVAKATTSIHGGGSLLTSIMGGKLLREFTLAMT